MSLYTEFEKINDPRRKQGLRTTLPQLFCMIIISNLCGHLGGRGVARFAKNHSKTFTKVLKLNHKIPSHVIFSDILNRVDSKELITAFNNWAKDIVPLKKGMPISGDGKALASTVSNQHGSHQDFEAVVSIFCQETGLVYAIEQYRNKKKSEIHIVQFLIKKLKNMGVVIHLDALHAQKKQ